MSKESARKVAQEEAEEVLTAQAHEKDREGVAEEFDEMRDEAAFLARTLRRWADEQDARVEVFKIYAYHERHGK